MDARYAISLYQKACCYAVPLGLKAFALVVLQREPELLDRAVTSSDGIHPVPTEVVTRVLHVILGALERRDGFANLRMWLATFTRGRPGGLLWERPYGDALNGRDGSRK